MSFTRVVLLAGVLGALAPLAGCSNAGPSKEDVASSESDLTSPGYLGQIASGQTKTTSYSNPPRYRAYGFSASAGDKITADVRSIDGDAMGWITDSSYAALASNDDASSSTLDSKVVYTVPAGTATKAYRIVFRDYDLLSATFDVTLTIDPAVLSCDPPTEHWRNYVGTPIQCETIRYVCKANQRSFENDCGCGCESLTH